MTTVTGHQSEEAAGPNGVQQSPAGGSSRLVADNDNLLLTVPEAAPILRLHPQTLYGLVRRGEIPSVRLGRKVFLHRPTLEAWLAGRVSFEPPTAEEDADAQKTTGSERLAGRGRSWTRPIDWPTPAKDNAGPRLQTGGQAG